jgi:acetyl-CoA carboxylase, biotin carboxylase subunit
MKRVLIANRGEIAVRVARACFDEGIESVLAVSEADRDSLAAQLVDRTVTIGPAAPAQSYLSVERVIAAALHADCDAIHPGYGFLSERPELAEACGEYGITFIGPPADVMRRAGDKMSARAAAKAVGIPIGGDSRPLRTAADAVAAARGVDALPVMMKASAGGGGRGMAIIRDLADIGRQFEDSHREALAAFGDGTLYLERYVSRARHVEVQILADRYGNVCHLADRDCSCQRRHQKLIEEGPAPDLPDALREEIRDCAVRLGRALNYEGAATVEFLVDVDRGDFVFLEVNARVQVEHPVTEMITGIDIVREQLRIAHGEKLSFEQSDVAVKGHAIEVRVNAENPAAGFRPSPGRITQWTMPQATGLRIDTYAFPGAVVQPYYDSLVAKVIAHASTRAGALNLMRRSLSRMRVEGIDTTADLANRILATPAFAEARISTRWLEQEFLASDTQEDE